MYHYLPLLSNVFQSIIYQFVCFNTLINFSVWGSFFKEKGRQKFDAKMRYPTKEWITLAIHEEGYKNELNEVKWQVNWDSWSRSNQNDCKMNESRTGEI